MLSSGSYDYDNEYAKFSKFPRFVAPSGANPTGMVENKAVLQSSIDQECLTPFSRREVPIGTGGPPPVSASALTSAQPPIGMDREVVMVNIGRRWKDKAPRRKAGKVAGQ